MWFQPREFPHLRGGEIINFFWSLRIYRLLHMYMNRDVYKKVSFNNIPKLIQQQEFDCYLGT